MKQNENAVKAGNSSMKLAEAGREMKAALDEYGQGAWPESSGKRIKTLDGNLTSMLKSIANEPIDDNVAALARLDALRLEIEFKIDAQNENSKNRCLENLQCLQGFLKAG